MKRTIGVYANGIWDVVGSIALDMNALVGKISYNNYMKSYR